MIILPAIDLKDGKCVRLRQGKAEDVTVYSDDPVAQALSWLKQGAEQLHVVDLDGAFSGEPRHTETIAGIVHAIGIPVEVGGGLRTDSQVEQLLAAGVARAIIGTRALERTDVLEALVKRFGGDRIAVGIDARDGFVQVKGWVETTSTHAVDLAKRVESVGVRTLIYTDTATDGMLGGPNLGAMGTLCRAVSCRVIASGGVSAPEHVRALKALDCPNLFGAIVGKALYDGKTTLAEMKAAAQ